MSLSWKKLDKAKALEVTLDMALKVLETTENVLNTTPIPGAAAVITITLEVLKRQERAGSNAKRTAEQQERWKKLVKQLEECETDTDSTPLDSLSTLRDASKALASELKDYARELREAITHGLRPRWMTCNGDEEALQDFLRKSNEAIADYQYAQGRRIEECVLKIQRVVGVIDTKVDRIDATTQAERETNKVKEWNRLVEKLPHAELAPYNADRSAGTLTSCSEGTREPLLADIANWAADLNTEKIYWLKERAGFGKTAVARSVAEQTAKEGSLAASFFFSYQIADLNHASHVITTIVYQLSLVGGAPYKQSLAEAIENHPNALRAQLKDQIRPLFLDPLKKFNLTSSNKPVVIIMDALDECQPEGAQQFISTFVAAVLSLDLPIKLFVTSRPESHLTAAFSDLGVKHRAMVDTSNEDVETYLRAELAEIPNKPGIRHINLPRDWITEADIQALLKRAGAKQDDSDSRDTEKGLFVYIATVVRFLGDTDACDPQKHLRILLSIVPSPLYRPYEALDAVYIRVLDLALRNRDDLLQRFRAVVGGLVAMQKDNITTTAFEALLDLPQGEVRRTLVNLQSVIQYPDTESTLPSFHHRSFTDFLIDNDRSGPLYYIDVEPHRKRFALGCLRLIATSPLKEEVTNAMNKDDYFFYPETSPPPDFRHATWYLCDYVKSIKGDKDMRKELERFIQDDLGWLIELFPSLEAQGGWYDCISDFVDPQDKQELPVLLRAVASMYSWHYVDFNLNIPVDALLRKELRRYISAVTQSRDGGV